MCGGDVLAVAEAEIPELEMIFALPCRMQQNVTQK
jgi:hypothetical protein